MLRELSGLTEIPHMTDVARQKYPFSLPDLPYPHDALEPHLDGKTLRIHHDAHHKTYVDKLNEALAGQPELHGRTLVELLRGIDELPDAVRTAVRNNGGGHYNHDLFWSSLSPNKHGGGGEPAGALAEAIRAAFGSFGAFREQFDAMAVKHFASGWVALTMARDGRLALADLQDHDVPPLETQTPIFIVDVWEHAYYVKFQNRRPDFLVSFWNVADWKATEKRFEHNRTAARV